MPDADVDLNNPREVADFLFPGEGDIGEIFNWIDSLTRNDLIDAKPQFPHDKGHIEMVKMSLEIMANACGLTDLELQNLKLAADLHDISYGLVEAGLVPYEHHNIASMIIAYMRTGNLDVANMVFYHNSDKTGLLLNSLKEFEDKSKSLLPVLLRDADQIALLSDSGLIRWAYWLGYRHPDMDKTFPEQKESGTLFDLKNDLTLNDGTYEEKVRETVMKSVIPWIVQNAPDSIKTLCQDYFPQNRNRFFSHIDVYKAYLRDLKQNENLYQMALKGHYSIVDFEKRSTEADIYTIEGMREEYLNIFLPLITREFTLESIFEELWRIKTLWTKNETEFQNLAMKYLENGCRIIGLK
ncbi:hypothetical protein HYV12_02620 [Candidatus Dojkabacteria bacterium]|nr:hypothetical protein [Candidatus Dojkabacteria bacterium]